MGLPAEANLMRSLLFTLHKYTGLTLGILLVISGLTGSLLVFHDALDEQLTPALITDGDSLAPLSVVIANAEAATGKTAQRIDLSRQPGSPHTLRFAKNPDAAGPLQVSVSPYSGEVLAVRDWGHYPMTWLYRLHYTLLAGNNGKIVVGILGLCLLGFCVTGVALWWPTGKRKGKWKRNLTVKRGAGRYRLHFDLHQVAGIYLLPVLLVIAFSGVSLVFGKQVSAIVGTTLPLQERPSPSSLPGEGAPLSADDAVALARSHFPDALLRRLYLPADPNGSYRVAFTLPDDAWQEHGANNLWLDQYSGERLALWQISQLPAGSQFMSWQFPLHNGDALGLPGRLVVMLSGLAPLLFFITGCYLWWTKRQLKRKASQRRQPRT
ncbi:PepSY domain-containing protein [Alcanivorax sp. S6407]|uniref:PepSY-associated TM helix domain-containing protein n=1 Tax=Alcanivorax sp. S6407 TaxID=2926424 RepID=UPI001FF4D14C|nr:PepSY domain-containing protein [Alcanivorax sp. S6407]